MRIPRLFVNFPLTEGQSVQLLPDRAHYLVNVLRLRTNDKLIVFNGQGGEFQATLDQIGKKTSSIKIEHFVGIDRESPLYTELAIGVSKGDRMDWIVQKSTELGVSSISPLITERSELKLNAERWQKKLHHWREIIISACEQCGRSLLPELKDPVSLQDYVLNCHTSFKVVLHPESNSTPMDIVENPKDIALLIGPEGGFSDEEVAIAEKNNFNKWTLGSRVLRTETAPIVALSLLQAKFGDF